MSATPEPGHDGSPTSFEDAGAVPQDQPTLPPRQPEANSATAAALSAEDDSPDRTRAFPLSSDGSCPAAETVPGYEILAVLGRGGMGVVYKARQLKLDRLVALKMILAGSHAGSEERDRFRTEAESIARLQHANIVQVHEIGEHEGKPFFSLEFCSGGSLEKKLQGTPLAPAEAAQLVRTLALAMQAAHEQNVIHRDLKPANVLLTADGTPRITDFGLAKKTDEVGQTATGAVMGTPSYMAPEQAGGQTRELGPACDIYALGAILYECLTGRPPFKAATPLDTVLQVVSDEPVQPSRLQSRTPADLETICLKCLHKEPKKRYASAAELAGDLERFLRGEPILARPVGRLERTAKWVRRNKGLSAGLAAAVLALLLGTFLASWQAVVASLAAASEASQRRVAEAEKQAADAARQTAEQQKQRAEDQLGRTELALYAGQLGQAQREWQDGNWERSLEILDGCQWDLRNVEFRHLWGRYNSKLTLLGRPGSIPTVAYSPDGKRIVSGSQTGTLMVWDAHAGTAVFSLKGHAESVTIVCFSPDGKQILTGGDDRTARVWDADKGTEIHTLKGHAGSVTSVCFRPDDQRILTGSEGGTVKVWDARTGREVSSLQTRSAVLAFRADGKRLVSAGPDNILKVWDLDRGEEVLSLKGHMATLVSAAFRSDGKRLASIGGDSTIKVWDLDKGQEILSFKAHTLVATAVAYSPDGNSLASASRDGTVKVWDAEKGQEIFTLQGHANGGD